MLTNNTHRIYNDIAPQRSPLTFGLRRSSISFGLRLDSLIQYRMHIIVVNVVLTINCPWTVSRRSPRPVG